MQQRSLGVLTLILAYGFSIDGTSTRLAVANNGPWPLPQVTSPADNPSTPEKNRTGSTTLLRPPAFENSGSLLRQLPQSGKRVQRW